MAVSMVAIHFLLPLSVEADNRTSGSLQKEQKITDNLPIVLIPSHLNDKELPIVFFISGDGGWTNFDQSISTTLAQNGFPVLGLDAQKYFWNKKSPQEASIAIAKLIRQYLTLWGRTKFVLTGYSFGADVAPFIADEFPEDLKKLFVQLFILSPDEKTDFEIHLTDMLGWGSQRVSHLVPPALRKLNQFSPVCLFGKKEPKELLIKFGETGSKIITLPGDHHYDNHPEMAAQAIVEELNKNQKNK